MLRAVCEKITSPRSSNQGDRGAPALLAERQVRWRPGVVAVVGASWPHTYEDSSFACGRASCM